MFEYVYPTHYNSESPTTLFRNNFLNRLLVEFGNCCGMNNQYAIRSHQGICLIERNTSMACIYTAEEMGQKESERDRNGRIHLNGIKGHRKKCQSQRRKNHEGMRYLEATIAGMDIKHKVHQVNNKLGVDKAAIKPSMSDVLFSKPQWRRCYSIVEVGPDRVPGGVPTNDDGLDVGLLPGLLGRGGGTGFQSSCCCCCCC